MRVDRTAFKKYILLILILIMFVISTRLFSSITAVYAQVDMTLKFIGGNFLYSCKVKCSNLLFKKRHFYSQIRNEKSVVQCLKGSKYFLYKTVLYTTERNTL